MTILPSPIPHPLDLWPWGDVPGWVYEALEWVIGVEWPEGDEKQVWDLADQWFAVASALVGPRDDAFAAAREVLSGYGGTGVVAEAFDAAWRQVAAGDEAPLLVLLTATDELGLLLEECGCDIEAAKIEVWIQVGILVVELISLVAAAVLTLGAASAAAGPVIAGTRVAIQMIFKRLLAQMAKKTVKQGVKEATEKAAKNVSGKGLKNFARQAGLDGVKEAGEEVGIDLGTQLYQNTTGRRDGLDLNSLGMSALGGAAAGATAPLAGLGPHASKGAGRFAEGVARGMAGEVLGETAASLATGGGLPDVMDLARSATSGAASTTISQTTQAANDARFANLSNVPSVSADLPELASLAGPSLSAAGSGSAGTGAGGVDPIAALAGPSTTGGSPATSAGPGPTFSGPVGTDVPRTGPPDTGAAGSDLIASAADTIPPAPPQVVETTTPNPAVETITSGQIGETVTSGPAVETGAGLNLASVATTSDPSTVATSGAASATVSPNTVDVGPADGARTSSAGGAPPTTGASGATSGTATATATTSTGAAPAPAPPPRTSTTGRTDGPSPDPVDAETARRRAIEERLRVLEPQPRPSRPRPTTPSPQQAGYERERQRRSYFEYSQKERRHYEQLRRENDAAELFHRADLLDDRARWHFDESRRWSEAGVDWYASARYRFGIEDAKLASELRDQVRAVRGGETVPDTVTIDDEAKFLRINIDVGTLASGAVNSGNRSALTGSDHPPSSDWFRRYDKPGGLRRPLALHQIELEQAMPRDQHGNLVRTADPRFGDWFRRVNDGGPRADATRSINCLDCSLSFYETWVHGRPRVSAPRTFDGYRNGNIDFPINGEVGGPARVEDVTGGVFQQLCPPVKGLSPAAAQQQVWRAYGDLRQQLLAGGHGSCAFIINTWEGGGAHAWIAVNQNGKILYLDPQQGHVRENLPLYAHTGVSYRGNVAAIDVLVLDAEAKPMPLADRPLGMYNVRPPAPEQRPVPQIDEDETVDWLHQFGQVSVIPRRQQRPVDEGGHIELPLDGPVDRGGHIELPFDGPVDRGGHIKLALSGPVEGDAAARAAHHATVDGVGAGGDLAPSGGGTERGGSAPEARNGSPDAGLSEPSGIPPAPAGPGHHGTDPGWIAPSPGEMFRDPTPQELRELGVGLADFSDLGLDPATLSDEERERYSAALPRTALVSPAEIRFTQRSVSPATSDGITLADLVENMRTGGWRGGPMHGVRWGDGSLTSLDNRQLRAARDAGLASVPFVVHSPSDRLADWPHEWSPERLQRNALGVEIRELPDGTWRVGGDEGRVVYAKGTVPRTYGEIALFRAAEQRSLLPGHLFGAEREPVLLAKPPGPLRAVDLSEDEQRVLDDLRLQATAAADRVEADLAAVGQAVTAGLGLRDTIELRGQEYRVKSAESLARKYVDEARAHEIGVGEFAERVNDVLRFSLVLPGGADFKPAMERVFAELANRGYTVDPASVKNFWKPGNRFYGFNCTVTAPDGQVFELQLPTELSWRAGKLTHEMYEVVRREDELPARRVHAFLQMLAANKRLAMADAIPPNVSEAVGVKDASFAKWILSNAEVWREYKAWLDLNDRSFADIVAEFGLDTSDFPISSSVASRLGEADVELLFALPNGRTDSTNRDLREALAARDPLGPPGEGVGVRPRSGEPVYAPPRQPRPLPEGGPGDGGASGAADHGRGETPRRGDDSLDLPVAGESAAGRRVAEAGSTVAEPPAAEVHAYVNERCNSQEVEPERTSENLDASQVKRLSGGDGDLDPMGRRSDWRDPAAHPQPPPRPPDAYLLAGDPVYHRPGGTAIGYDSSTLRNFDVIAPEPGYHDVVVHGVLSGMFRPGFIGADGEDYLSGLTHPQQIADAIQANPHYDGGPVRLVSCHSGTVDPDAGVPPAAQQVADALRVPVMAPTDAVGIDRYGPLGQVPVIRGDGRWKIYYPKVDANGR